MTRSKIDDDTSATTAWLPEELSRSRSPAMMYLAALGLLLAGLIVVLVLWKTSGSGEQVAPKRAPPIAAATTAATRSPELPPVHEDWWTPPRATRETVNAPAYGFAGIDEDDLGRVFSADFKPIFDAPNLFEQRPAKHVRRGELMREVIRLRDVGQFNAGFQALFVSAGVSYKTDREYLLYRAGEVEDIVKVDETARMHHPPDNALFYLAEVHRGASYDVMVDAEASEMGAKLSAVIDGAEPSFSTLQASGRYHLVARGLGLRDATHDGIFADSPNEIAKRYRTGVAVPVTLVFRTIPGREYRPKKLRTSAVIVDEQAQVEDGQTTPILRLSPGTYRVVASSRPNGLRVEWLDGYPTCDKPPRMNEYKEVNMTCIVDAPLRIRFANPSLLNMGPAEQMNTYVARMP